MIHELGNIPSSRQKGISKSCIKLKTFIDSRELFSKEQVISVGYFAKTYDKVTFLWEKSGVFLGSLPH